MLKDPRSTWNRPALTTYLHNNHAVRDDRWRYIRYNDGTEELYDETADPHEWTNVADKPENADVKARLMKFLPKANVPAVTAGNEATD